MNFFPKGPRQDKREQINLKELLELPDQTLIERSRKATLEWNNNPSIKHIPDHIPIQNAFLELPTQTTRFQQITNFNGQPAPLAGVSLGGDEFYSAFSLNELFRWGLSQFINGYTSQEITEMITSRGPKIGIDQIFVLFLHEKAHVEITHPIYKLFRFNNDTGVYEGGRDNSLGSCPVN